MTPGRTDRTSVLLRGFTDYDTWRTIESRDLRWNYRAIG